MSSKSLDELRDAGAERRAKMQCSSGCEYTDKVWQRHLKIGFEDGFDAAIKAVSEREKKLVDALEKLIRLSNRISVYSRSPSYSQLASHIVRNHISNLYLAQCEAEDALKDYQGEK